jgi:hypothetical protein
VAEMRDLLGRASFQLGWFLKESEHQAVTVKLCDKVTLLTFVEVSMLQVAYLCNRCSLFSLPSEIHQQL